MPYELPRLFNVKEKEFQSINSIAEAFEHFNRATKRLMERYETLQKKVESMNIELEIKNAQLSKILKEKSEAEEKLQRAKTFSALGEMAINIAHEVRNPLGAIELFLDILHQDLMNDARKNNIVEKIKAGIQSLNSIVSNLLFFARPLRPDFRKISITLIVDNLLQFSMPLFKQKNISVIRKYTINDATINGDVEHLKQVFLNIILNACQAMEEGGKLTVLIRRKTNTQNDFSQECKNIKYIEVVFEDTGMGISKEYIDKIYNPFFTTKNKGTGLGLSIAQKILDDHEALIKVKSKVSHGTSFSISFPVKEEDCAGK